VAIALVAVSTLLGGCRTTAQFAPSLPRVVGVQVDNDRLRILIGAPCPDVTRIVLVFSGTPDGRPDRAVLEAAAPTTVDRVSVDQDVVVDGFDATETLPRGFDWREYSELDVVLDRSASEAGGATSDLGPLKKAGAKHEGDGTAYVRGEGWLTSRQIAAGDEKDFLTACTPDPAKK
jgi:hypothetical protein